VGNLALSRQPHGRFPVRRVRAVDYPVRLRKRLIEEEYFVEQASLMKDKSEQEVKNVNR